METEKATLQEIARLCGVSRMTVSRVLRDDPNVSDLMRKRVLTAAERGGYIPRGIRTERKRGKFHIVFQDEFLTRDAFFGEVVRCIHQELFTKGHSCSLSVISGGYEGMLKLQQTLQSENVDGILAVGPVSPEFLRPMIERFPNVVLVDDPGGPEFSGPYSSVSYDTVYGSSLAVRHLLDLGRKRVLLIHGPTDVRFFRDMLAGYKEAAGEYDPQLTISREGYHVNDGYETMKEALAAGKEFDAVFANDEMACGAMRALAESGLRVPEDAAVVGFDNLPLGEAVSPTLTTVAVDRKKMSRTAVELLLGSADQQKISYFPALIVRQSCGARGIEE